MHADITDDRTMKIAYLINTYPSPSHSFIRREIAALEAQGWEVQRFALRPASERAGLDEERERDRTRYVLQSGLVNLIASAMLAIARQPFRFLRSVSVAARMGYRGDSGLVKHVIYLIEACTLLRWLHAERIDHVHVHFGTNATTVALLCRLLGGPSYSFTAHGPEEFDQPRSLCLSEKIEHASFVVAVCSYGRSQLFRWCGRQHWDKIHIIRCGVDQLFLHGADQPVEKSATLLQVGRLSEQKGQLLLIDAARRLLDQGIEFKLTLVGDGELRGELERRIASQKLNNHVTLAGWKTGAEIRQMMLGSRALVMPSFAEGLPVVLMESLALKRPVISTYVAGIPELVGNGVCGWLVPAGDVAALADAMAEALSASADQLKQFGEAGRQRVVERHDASREATHLASLFRRAIAEAPPAAMTDIAVQLNHAV